LPSSSQTLDVVEALDVENEMVMARPGEQNSVKEFYSMAAKETGGWGQEDNNLRPGSMSTEISGSNVNRRAWTAQERPKSECSGSSSPKEWMWQTDEGRQRQADELQLQHSNPGYYPAEDPIRHSFLNHGDSDRDEEYEEQFLPPPGREWRSDSGSERPEEEHSITALPPPHMLDSPGYVDDRTCFLGPDVEHNPIADTERIRRGENLGILGGYVGQIEREMEMELEDTEQKRDHGKALAQEPTGEETLDTKKSQIWGLKSSGKERPLKVSKDTIINGTEEGQMKAQGVAHSVTQRESQISQTQSEIDERCFPNFLMPFEMATYLHCLVCAFLR
jgi:hypothetical protein